MPRKTKNFLLIFSYLFILGLFSYQYHLPRKHKMRDVPYADEKGMIIQVKTIRIPEAPNAYNGSILEKKDPNGGYWFVFRHDHNDTTNIGCIELDKRFHKISDARYFDVKSPYAEDARIFQHNKEYFLIYNDCTKPNPFCRSMNIAKVHPENQQVDFITNLDIHIKKSEKNWVPFSYTSTKNNHEKFMLAYRLMPHKIMRLKDLKKNSLKHYVYPDNPCYRRFLWRWGTPRGGSPAKLVDGEYLAFFHSSYRLANSKQRQYVMGAYTFKAHPPFYVTRVSKYPIYFRDIKKAKQLFPAGFVQDHMNGKEVFHVSFGENDRTNKIVTIDKQKLYESLRPID